MSHASRSTDSRKFRRISAASARTRTRQIALLRRLPLAFVPLLLRELIVYDWKFPAERVDLDRQFMYLGGLTPGPFRAAMSAFAELKVTRELEKIDWVNSPAIFSEQFSAHLWATHQIDTFRAAAVDYVRKSRRRRPSRSADASAGYRGDRAGGGEEAIIASSASSVPRASITRRSNTPAARRCLLDAVRARAEAHPVPYGHWYIDGGASLAAPKGVTRISYDGLSTARAVLQNRMQKTYEAPVFDPEAFRTMMAQIKPEEAGLNSAETRRSTDSNSAC